MKLIKPLAFGLCLLLAALAGAGAPVRPAAAQSFDVCVEDDSNKATAIRFNSTTGDYMACAGGASLTGRGSVQKTGSVVSLQVNTAERRINARVDTSAKQGSAAIQSPPGTTRGSARDSNTANSTCGCR